MENPNQEEEYDFTESDNDFFNKFKLKNYMYQMDDQRKNNKISISLIIDTSLNNNMKDKTEKQIMEDVCNLDKIHLEWLEIEKIQNLEIFTNLKILFLQHNKIKKIENLETLINLEYLALNGNAINIIENLRNLKNLSYLNLSENLIEAVNIAQIPESIEYLFLEKNKFSNENYEEINKKIIMNLENILEIDGIQITAEIRFHLMGIFPKNLEDYNKNLKKAIKDKDEVDNNLNFSHEYDPIYKTDEDINELNDKILKETKNFENDLKQKTNLIIERTKNKIDETQKEFMKEYNETIKLYGKAIRIVKTRGQCPKIDEIPEENNEN